MSLTTEDLHQIKNIVDESVTQIVTGIVTGAVTRATGELRGEFKLELGELKAELKAEIRVVREMLEDDARAESRRLTRVDRRSMRTQRLLRGHMADSLVHLAA